MSDSSNPASDKTSIGSLLRGARQSRGESLDDAARITRIGKGYLSSLEEDAFDRLPSPAYAKGFLRVYGKHLGLSPDDLIGMYEEQFGNFSAGDSGEERGVPSGVKGPSFNMGNRWTIPLLLLALVLVTATIVPERDPEPIPTYEEPPVAGALVPQKSVQLPVSSAVKVSAPAAEEKTTVEHESSIPETAATASVAPGMILRMKVNQDCWLNINIDGTVSQQYDLRAGDLIEWKGERFFSLDLGNAGGVEIEFNGKPLPPAGEIGKSAHLVLPAENSEQQ